MCRVRARAECEEASEEVMRRGSAEAFGVISALFEGDITSKRDLQRGAHGESVRASISVLFASLRRPTPSQASSLSHQDSDPASC